MSSLRLLYIVVRNADIAGVMAFHNGQIIANLPNYFRVYDSPVKPEAADEFCLCIRVPEDKIKEVIEREGPVLRLWEGPKESNQYPQYKIRADAFNMETPMAAGAVDPAMVEEANQLKLEVAQLKEKLSAAELERGQAIEVGDNAERAAVDLAIKVRTLETTIARLRDQLSQATTGTVIREITDKVLAEVISKADDKILELMPHCGPETVVHFKNWAAEELAK